ncbi:MAG: hypothetical protein SGBAC_005174 [Bacillariaceae sp.]
MNYKASLFLASTFMGVASAVPAYDYSVAPSGTKRCAVVSIAMDESGSMKTEQAFMKQYAIPRMTNVLYSDEYQYDHVFFCSFGFGWLQAPLADHRFRSLGCTEGVKDFTGGFVNALHDPAITNWENESGGEEEDGFNAIIAGVDALPASIVGPAGNVDINNDCAVFNKNFILVTDEDRDLMNPAATTAAVRSAMADNGYILNEVVNLNMELPETAEAIVGLRVNYPASALVSTGTTQVCVPGLFPGTQQCQDVDVFDGVRNEWFSTNILEQNGHEGAWTTFINEVPPDNFYGDGFGGNTDTDYIPLIQETRGAIWSVRPVRQSLSVDDDGVLMVLNETKIEAFAEAFIDIKVNEIDCTTNCECLAPPCRNTEGLGDPHFSTWRNEHYEYHGQCDLVMMKQPEFADGLGIDVHIRTKIVRFWSYIKNVAIRIGNDILEIQGSADAEDAEAHYWVNFEYQGDLDTFAGFPVTQKLPSVYKRQYTIDLSSKYPGEFITVQIFKEFVKVQFSAGSKSFGTSVGMLGDYYSGKTLARDGQTVINDFVELGHEWQVLPSEPKLFRALEHPQFPEQCLEPEDPRGERRRRLEESTVSIEQAEEACKTTLKDPLSIKDCVYDILATQDLDMVGAF